MSAEVKSMKEWALYYAELGLAVFPLAYRNKVPAIEGGCKAATRIDVTCRTRTEITEEG